VLRILRAEAGNSFMDGPRQVPRHLQRAFHERLVDDELGGVISEWGVTDEFDMPGERLEVPLHPVDAHGDGIDQAEVFRVLGEDRREIAMERHVVTDENPVADAHGEAHTLIVGVADTAPCILMKILHSTNA